MDTPSALRSRNAALVSKLLIQYGLTDARILPAQSGYRNQNYPVEWPGSPPLNLILYKSDPDILTRIRHANTVGNFAATHGLPARRTYDPRILCLRTPTRVKYAALYHYLPGHTIPWEAYTMRHLKLLGASLQHLHASLRQLPPHIQLAPVQDEYAAILRRMASYFDQPDVRQALAAKIGYAPYPHAISRTQHVLHASHSLSGSQALHMDFVRSNILFEGAGEGLRISGLLDFEKTAWGHPVFDIARTLAFLLVDCKSKTPTQTRKYFLISGYGKPFRAPTLTSRGHRLNLLEELLDLFLLYDWYKFLRHNPYEFLAHNEHYRRTTALLIQRNLLKVLDKPSKTIYH